MTATVTAAVYARISLDDQDTRDGVTRQVEDGIAECTRRGWTPILFVDNNISASNGKHRPEYRKMLRAVQAGQVGAIVAWANDRITRHPAELEEFIDVVNRAGVKVATCRSGDYDLSTPDGRMLARILGSIAKGETEKMGSRIARAKLQAAQQGLPNPGGRRPFGFRDDKVAHHPEEADAIRRAASGIIAGRSLRAVARELGFPTTTACRRTLCSPRMAGLRMAGNEEVRAVWEPIIDPEDWRVMKAILEGKPRHPGAVPNRRYLLSGFLRCGTCGEVMHHNPTLGSRRYACPNDHAIRQAEMIEAYVTERVLIALESPTLLEALRAADDAENEVDTRALAAELARREAQIREAKTAWLHEGIITKADFVAAEREHTARIDEIRTILSARAGVHTAGAMPIGTPRIRKAWAAGDLQQRRELIDVVVDRITVHKAGKGSRRIKPDTVDIAWRV